MGYLATPIYLVIVLIGLYLVSRSLEPPVSQNEPFLLRAKFPLFGHLFGMLRNGNAYLQHIS